MLEQNERKGQLRLLAKQKICQKKKAFARIHGVKLLVGLWGDAYDGVFVYLNPAGGTLQDITLHPILRWKQNGFIALNVQ